MQDAHTDHWLITVDGYLDRLQGRELFGTEELATVDGTRTEAEEALWRQAHAYNPPRPWHVRQWWLYQDGDGYRARYKGMSGREYLFVFRLARLVWSSKT